MCSCAPVYVFSQGVLSLSNRMKLALMKQYPSETCAHSHAKLVYVCNTHVPVCVRCVCIGLVLICLLFKVDMNIVNVCLKCNVMLNCETMMRILFMLSCIYIV